MIIKMMNEDVECWLRRLRIAKGYSQNDIVENANFYLKALTDTPILLDRVSLSKAENNSIILIPSHVRAIATFLDCTENDIYPWIYPEEPAG